MGEFEPEASVSNQEGEVEGKISATEIARLIREQNGVQGPARELLNQWLDTKQEEIEAQGVKDSTRGQVNIELRLARIYEQGGRTESAVAAYRNAARSIVWQSANHKPQEQQFFETVLKPRINALLGKPKDSLIELDTE